MQRQTSKWWSVCKGYSFNGGSPFTTLIVSTLTVMLLFFVAIIQEVADGLFSDADRGVRACVNQPCREWRVLRVEI